MYWKKSVLYMFSVSIPSYSIFLVEVISTSSTVTICTEKKCPLHVLFFYTFIFHVHFFYASIFQNSFSSWTLFLYFQNIYLGLKKSTFCTFSSWTLFQCLQNISLSLNNFPHFLQWKINWEKVVFTCSLLLCFHIPVLK